ncbi:uncharacterized protein K452DRAFT_232144 [Aplosporella prunicola CBS 121167]|uniref:t-SNARE coiled-coil homology domain-containing protein n=1 Tax=Aplosporella prunicola CBS 121167 TaxID=1176127 RepID=A0A6A6B7H1_9PEZI|nr:uncharacterized protein K452DRAFT_232144 [Aplosporella prunicola CBS 121167]KAF2139558.1 hypothetical protein K452DRAFT_232144 [Aplosporella prunicola CBS 121167]
MPLDISIPTTSVSSSAKPFTIYTVSIRQPLRTTTINKRYSDFEALHTALTSSVNEPPPASLPGKHWFSSTVNNPTLTEHRRRELEAYLTAIETDSDARWRHTSAWRSFLDLGATQRGSSSGTKEPGRGGLGIKDAGAWLTVHQDLKSQLHQARLALTRREQAQTAQAQHEAGATAKKFLVLAGTLIVALEEGLKTLGGGSNDDFTGEKLGDGELRRRRDLITGARKEKEGLEGILNAMAVKTAVGASTSSLGANSGTATPLDKAGLFSRGARTSSKNTTNIADVFADPPVPGISRTPTSRRTLGGPAPETQRTRELDNSGVLQLQQQMMREQDEDVTDLTKAVRRMREMGVQIADELELQNTMLGMLDEDVDRVGGKIDVAKKRIARIR